MDFGTVPTMILFSSFIVSKINIYKMYINGVISTRNVLFIFAVKFIIRLHQLT